MPRAFRWFRWANQVLGGVPVDETLTTFVSADYTPVADGTTPTDLTFTAKDAEDAPIAGRTVTYA